MTEKEALRILDNVFTTMLIEKEIGEEFSTAIKTILTFYKFYKNGFEKELKGNRENIVEIIEQENKIKAYEKTIRKKEETIEKMAEYIDWNCNCIKGFDKCIEYDDPHCINCIIEYFEKENKQ